MPKRLLVTIISTGKFAAGPGAPVQARLEVALGGPGLAADDDGDPFASPVLSLPLLHERGAGGHRELDLDHAGDRHDVPFA